MLREEGRERRAVIYARCSTDESRQDVDLQLKEIRRYVQAYGFVFDEIAEYGSGYKGEQPRLDEVIEKIKRGHYSLLLVYSLDRFSRQHPKKTNALLDQIVYDHQCRFVSLKEGLDSENEMIWHVVRPLFSYFANVFSRQLSEKIRAGIKNKKEKGIYKGGGKPKLIDMARLQSILSTRGRLPYRQLADIYNEGITSKKLKASYQTLRKAVLLM